MMMKKICALLVAGVLSQWAMADVTSIQNQLKSKYPTLNIENVKTTEMPGIYSATVAEQVIYT